MTLTIRRPVTPVELPGAIRRLDQALDDAFSGWPFTPPPAWNITSAWLPPTDVFEDKEAIRIVCELPGLKPEDVRLTLENQTLTIRGEKKQVPEEKAERVYRYERTYGSFERSFSLPNSVDPERVQASFEHGVLTVTLPKVENARPREISVAAK